MPDRTLHGPPLEWLSSTEAATWLNVPESTFLLLARRGVIPDGIRWSGKTKAWHWEVVVAVSVLMKVGFIKPPPSRGKNS